MEFPMNGDLLNLISYTVKKATEETIAELKRQNLITEGRQTPFQRVETLLFNYNNFRAAIQDKEEQIEELKQYGLRKKSPSISSFNGGVGYVETKTEQEQIEERIALIQLNIQTTINFIKIIDDALLTLKDDPYYDLIELRYFKGKSREAIAEYFDCDVKTVTRNKNRLIDQLQIRLFSDQVIRQIFSY